MTWSQSSRFTDRIFACLPYLLPLLDSLISGLARFLLGQFPLLALILFPLQPVIIVYASLGSLGQLVLFFALFMLVVRNDKVNHFIRFNTMQAILLDIIVFLGSIVLRIVSSIPGSGFTIETASNVIFLGIITAVVYSIFQAMIGRYAEIPVISEAVNSHVIR